MDSIYGGRPGAPFVIKSVFQSIKDMQEKFKKGAEFKDVWFGEYCIIDTPNKNDWDNGKIYQRGPEWFNDDGDAKYIGQIVGPQSGVPSFEFGTLEDVQNYTDLKEDGKHVEPYPEVEQGKPGYETRTWPYDFNTQDAGGNKTTVEKLFLDRQESCSPDNHPKVKIKESGVKSGLVPGGPDGVWTEATSGFKDSIRYNWVNIAYPYGTGEDDAKLFASANTLVGFEVPYTVQQYKIFTRLPYDSAGNYAPVSVIEEDKITKGKHPFAYLWNLTIPMGIKGDSIRNIRVDGRLKEACLFTELEFSTAENGYKVSAPGSRELYVENDPRNKITGWGEKNKTKAKFWYCDFVHFSKLKGGESITILLGSANEISNVTYNNNTGELQIEYTNAVNPNAFNIPAINRFSFTDSTGAWTVGFNNSAVGLVDENFPGSSVSEDKKSVTGQLKLMKDTSYSKDNGNFTVNYTKGKSEIHAIPSVNQFKFDSTTGAWTVGFNNSAVGLNQDDFTGGKVSTDKKSVTGQLKFISGASVVEFDPSENLDGTKITFSDSSKEETGSATINGIFELYSDLGPDKSNHLYALYTSKEARKNDEDTEGFRKNIQSSRTDKNTKGLNWKDLGSIKDQSGVLIGHDLSSDTGLTEDAKTSSDKMLEWLNENRQLHYDGTSYIDGSNHGYNDGKLSTYVDKDGTTWFFAWDYSKKPQVGDCAYWYFVGKSTSDSGNKVSFSNIKGSREHDWDDVTWEYPVPERAKPGDLVILQCFFEELDHNAINATYGNWWEVPGDE